jgi:hypothetical protein
MLDRKREMREMTERTVIKNVLVHDSYGREYPFYDSGHTRYTHTVWNEETQSPDLAYTYDSEPVTMIPATPEMIAAWEAYKTAAAIKLRYENRKRDVTATLQHRRELQKAASTMNVHFMILIGLERSIGKENTANIIRLVTSFISNRLRSSFKESLATQCLEWFNEPTKREKFPKGPLSPKQMSYLHPSDPKSFALRRAGYR